MEVTAILPIGVPDEKPKSENKERFLRNFLQRKMADLMKSKTRLLNAVLATLG